MYVSYVTHKKSLVLQLQLHEILPKSSVILNRLLGKYFLKISVTFFCEEKKFHVINFTGISLATFFCTRVM